jgi:hypothetical protein
MLIGFGFATIRMDRFSKPGPGGPLEFMDTIPWPGVFWIVCGIIATANGLIRRKIDNEDAIGYAALVMPPSLWVVAYLWSFATWVYTYFTWPPDEESGRMSSFIGAGAFGIISIVIVIVSHWRDDLDNPETPRGSQELALLDAMVETKEQNDERGDRARAASEKWIGEARMESERNIQTSGKENDRRIAASLEERRRNKDNIKDQDQNG